jgi:hypothetical protein
LHNKHNKKQHVEEPKRNVNVSKQKKELNRLSVSVNKLDVKLNKHVRERLKLEIEKNVKLLRLLEEKQNV